MLPLPKDSIKLSGKEKDSKYSKSPPVAYAASLMKFLGQTRLRVLAHYANPALLRN